MRRVSCKITHPDCSETAIGVVRAQQLVELFETHDWEKEARDLAARDEAQGESCYPGLELETDDGYSLNFLPETDGEVYIHYRYPVGDRKEPRVAQILLPRSELPQFAERLDAGDHAWILAKSLRPSAATIGLVSLGAMVVGFIVGGTWALMRYWGVDLNRNLELVDVVKFLAVATAMILAACLVWLSLARAFLTREEAHTGWSFYGRDFKVDRWLFELFFPEPK